MRILPGIASGQFRAPGDIVRHLITYPNEGDMRSVRPSIRAMEIAMENLSVEDKLLISVRRDPEISFAQRGVNVGLDHPQKTARHVATED